MAHILFWSGVEPSVLCVPLILIELNKKDTVHNILLMVSPQFIYLFYIGPVNKAPLIMPSGNTLLSNLMPNGRLLHDEMCRGQQIHI